MIILIIITAQSVLRGWWDGESFLEQKDSMPSGEMKKAVKPQSSYKYLGILEAGGI